MSIGVKRLLRVAAAVLALSGIAASSSQAASFTASTYPATIKGEQLAFETHAWTFAGGRSVTCQSATFAGSLGAASSTLTISPTYSACHANILGAILPATVTFGNCDYLFHITGGAGDAFTGTTDLVCPVGDVEIHVYKEGTVAHLAINEACEFTLKGQTGIGPLDYTTQTGSLNDIQFKWTANNIAYTRLGGTLAACGATSGTATYTGNTTMKAFNAAGTQISFSID